MFLDATLGLSAAQAITVTAPSTGTYDTAGLGVGVPVTNAFGIQDSSFGNDIGIGDSANDPKLAVIIGAAFTAGGAATLTVQLQAAVDTNNTGTPGTWDTLLQSDALPLSVLTAGQKIAEFDVPPRYPGQGFPRFYRLNYVVATGPMTAGTISYAGIVLGRDDQPTYPSAY